MTPAEIKAELLRDFAEALECFWNAAINAAHNQRSPTAMDCASVMAEGFAAVANRLRELADGAGQ